jgi:hypothetical protein
MSAQSSMYGYTDIHELSWIQRLLWYPIHTTGLLHEGLACLAETAHRNKYSQPSMEVSTYLLSANETVSISNRMHSKCYTDAGLDLLSETCSNLLRQSSPTIKSYFTCNRVLCGTLICSFWSPLGLGSPGTWQWLALAGNVPHSGLFWALLPPRCISTLKIHAKIDKVKRNNGN